MRKVTTPSKTGLFLMEMILALLFLSLSCAACIQVFAAARTNRSHSREWNHIQELTISVGEVLEGTDGSADAILTHLPGGAKEDGTLCYEYDCNWALCAKASEGVYEMRLTPGTGPDKSCGLTFLSGEKELYRTELHFPRPHTRGEAAG